MTPSWTILDNYNEWKALLHAGVVKHHVYSFFESAVLTPTSSVPTWTAKVGQYIEMRASPPAAAEEGLAVEAAAPAVEAAADAPLAPLATPPGEP